MTSSNYALQKMENLRGSAEALLARIEPVNQEAIPMAMVSWMSRGESPVVVWREHRTTDRAQPASAAQLPEAEIEALESGNADPGLRVMSRIARVLSVDVEDLVPASQD